MESFREIGKRLSNWGRWGPDDRIGTLNHLTPDRLAASITMLSGTSEYRSNSALSTASLTRAASGPRKDRMATR